MKNRVFVLTMLLAVSLAGCANTKQAGNAVADGMYKVMKIKKMKSAENCYTIYAKRRDSIFKIISCPKDLEITNGEMVRVGKAYDLNLQVFFPRDSLFGIPVAPNLGIEGVIVGGQMVATERRAHNTIYFVLNMSGLYIFPNEKRAW